MSSVGLGYDDNVTIYSPDGRLYQIEYAQKATEQAGTLVALRCKDGVVMALENARPTKLLIPNTNQRAKSVDPRIGLAGVGVLADAVFLRKAAQEKIRETYKSVDHPPRTLEVVKRIAAWSQIFTCYGAYRVLGVSSVVAGWDAPEDPARVAEGTPALYNVDVSGNFQGFRGLAAGRGRVLARTEIEKLDLDNLSARDALYEAVRILLLASADVKNTEIEVEVTWIAPETGYEHTHLDPAQKDALEQRARAALDEEVEMVD